MRLKWPSRKHRAPKMRLVEAHCDHRKHCPTYLGVIPLPGSHNIFCHYFRKLNSMNVLAELTNCCNVTIGAVLLWKLRIIRLQLQFFFRRRVGINDCNVTLQSYWNLSWQNTICNNFVSNGTCDSPACVLSTSLFFRIVFFLRLLERLLGTPFENLSENPLKPTARHLLRTLLATFSKTVSRTLPRTLLRGLLHPLVRTLQ